MPATNNDDTVNLLRECSAGTQMAVFSIDEILEKVRDEKLGKILSDSKKEHEKLGDTVHAYLKELNDAPKDPGIMAKGMSWLETNAKIMMDDGDKTIASLITDGCNMGIKTVQQHLNDYAGANKRSKELAEELIRLEETLRHHLRDYL